MQKAYWHPQQIDLIISLSRALSFPLLAAFLYSNTGALLPIVLYFLLAWGICLLRRGETGYFKRPVKKPPLFFYINLVVIITALILAYFSRIQTQNSSITGIILTTTIWAVINAASEQLLWIYIFESWDLNGKSKGKSQITRFLFKVAGLFLFTLFVAMIHILDRLFHGSLFNKVNFLKKIYKGRQKWIYYH